MLLRLLGQINPLHDRVHSLAHGPSAGRWTAGMALDGAAYGQHHVKAEILDDARRAGRVDAAAHRRHRRLEAVEGHRLKVGRPQILLPEQWIGAIDRAEHGHVRPGKPVQLAQQQGRTDAGPGILHQHAGSGIVGQDGDRDVLLLRHSLDHAQPGANTVDHDHACSQLLSSPRILYDLFRPVGDIRTVDGPVARFLVDLLGRTAIGSHPVEHGAERTVAQQLIVLDDIHATSG